MRTDIDNSVKARVFFTVCFRSCKVVVAMLIMATLVFLSWQEKSASIDESKIRRIMKYHYVKIKGKANTEDMI